MRVIFASCVEYAPLSGLASELRRLGHLAKVAAPYSDLKWRQLMSGNRMSVLRARATSLLWLPFRMVLAAVLGSEGVLVATTNPFHLPWVATFLRPLHRMPVVVLVYDLYPDALEAAGHTASLRWTGRLAVRLNRWTFQNADGVVFIGTRMRDHAFARYGEPRYTALIHTGAAPERIPPDAGSDAILFSYVGNLGFVHDWETFVGGLNCLDILEGQARFTFAASGPGGADLKRALRGTRHNVPVTTLPPLDESAWHRLLCETDVALVSLKTEAKQVSVPSKVFSAMGFGAAVLAVAPVDSDLAEVVQASGCGLVVEPGDLEGFARAVETLSSNKALLRKMQDCSRRAVEEHYSYRACAEQWDSVLERATRP
ncbi:MAG: glycosyltransferase family 4 protein [Euzebya sp.]